MWTLSLATKEVTAESLKFEYLWKLSQPQKEIEQFYFDSHSSSQLIDYSKLKGHSVRG